MKTLDSTISQMSDDDDDDRNDVDHNRGNDDNNFRNDDNDIDIYTDCDIIVLQDILYIKTISIYNKKIK